MLFALYVSYIVSMGKSDKSSTGYCVMLVWLR